MCSIIGNLHSGPRGFLPVCPVTGFPLMDAESQGVDITSAHHTVNGVGDGLLTMSYFCTLQGFESDTKVMIGQHHLVIDLINDEGSECSDGEGTAKPKAAKDAEVQDHPPQPDEWDLSSTKRVEQLLARLANDFKVEMDAAFPDFAKEVRVC